MCGRLIDTILDFEYPASRAEMDRGSRGRHHDAIVVFWLSGGPSLPCFIPEKHGGLTVRAFPSCSCTNWVALLRASPPWLPHEVHN